MVAAMSRLELKPFTGDHVPDAGALLAERHRQHRAAQPLLSARYEGVEAATAEVAAALAQEDASGAVALRDGRVVGYLLGAPKANPSWGTNVWIEAAGHAATEAETIRDLYGLSATRWVEEGRTAQYVLVPAMDAALVRAWFRLCFGHQHTHGIRAAPTQVAPPVAGVTVRWAVRADIAQLAMLDVELPRHQGLAPTFASGTVPTVEHALSEWESDFGDPEYAVFVAERDGEMVGSLIGCALEKSHAHTGLARPDNAGFLGFAAVFAHARGGGVGRALGNAMLNWTMERGFDSVVTDWRQTNLLSSRAWPAFGFTENFIRLHRLVGH
jgi:GNAT superfamily N-acetyltransferase